MKRPFIIILLLSAMAGFVPAMAQTGGPVDLDALYQQIDEAISQSPQYTAARKRQIDACRDSFLMEKDMEQRAQTAERLFLFYQPYNNDSAFHYAEVCIDLAESLHRPDLVGKYRSMLAYQCSNVNLYTESLDQLHKVDKSALDSTGLLDYYKAWMHVCGELGSNTPRQRLKQDYYDMQDNYRDSVLMVTKEGSEEWYHLKVDILCARRLFQDALALSDEWLQKVKAGSHESAFAAFYRSMVYDHLKNHDMTCYWLGQSALDDIKCAVTDQASLLFLSEHLANDGDAGRARRYAEFAKSRNLDFFPRLRYYQVGPYVHVIDKDCEAARSHADLVLIIASVAATVFLAALAFTLLRLRRARAKTRNG